MATKTGGFVSLSAALAGWFDKSLTVLPQTKRERVEREFAPLRWDSLTPDQRESWAQRWDYENDPAKERDRANGLAFWKEYEDLKRQIADWENVPVGGARDLDKREKRLKALRPRFAILETKYKRLRGDDLDSAAAPTPRSGRPKTRTDLMGAEIESAIQELGDKWKPLHVMRTLKSYCKQPGSCITSLGNDYVVWTDSIGDERKLTMSALRKRLAYKKSKTDNAR